MLLTMGISGFAQNLGDYTFSTGTDATKWIQLNTTTTIATTGDAGKSSVLDIGFPFIFGEESYSQFSVSADGNLRLGGTVTGTSNYTTPFSTTNANQNNPKINFLGCDGFLSDSGHVYHEVVGDAPNRICVIEFATSTYNTVSRPSLLRWQVQLFEGSNDIQIVYASTAPPILPNVTRQVGLCVNASDVILVNASHQSTHYTSGQSSTIATGTWPDVDRYYLFEAPVITCPKVADITSDNLTSNSVDLSWTPAGSESNWDIYVASSATDVPGNNTTPTDYVSGLPQYTMSNLTANTTYYVYVRANCGGNDVSLWKPYSFTTPCEAEATLPMSFNFDNVPGSTSGSTNNLPACWNYLNESTSTTYSGYPIVYSGADYAHSGSNSLRFYVYTTSGTYEDEYAILPPVDVNVNPINTLQISFQARAYSSYKLNIVVGVMMNPADKNTFVPIDTIIANTTTYSAFEVPLTNYTGTGNFIALKAPRPSTSYNAGYVDDIVVDLAPLCTRPNHLSAVTSTNDATLTWESTGTTFDLYYKAASESDYTVVNNVSLTDGEYHLSGLTASTLYYWYVQTACGMDEELASVEASFYTTVIPEYLPYTTDFSQDVWVLNNGSCVNYWAQGAISDSAYGLFVTNNGTAQAYTVGSAGAVTAEKSFVVGDASSFVVSFDFKCGGEGNFDFIKVFLAPEDVTYAASNTNPAWAEKDYTVYAANFADFFPLTTASSTALDYTYKICLTGGDFIHVELPMSNPIENPDASSLAKLVIGWRNDGSGGTQPGAIITNLQIVAASCDYTSTPVVSNIQPYSADVAWSAPDGASNFVVQYVASNLDWDDESVITLNVSDTTMALANLSPATTYLVRVANDCGGQYSIWKFTSFTTECAGLTSLPYFCDMETVPSGSNPLPNCWTKGSLNATYPYSISSTSSYAGNRSLYFYTANYVCLPPVDPTAIDLTGTQLTFYAKGNNYVLQVGVMSDPNNASTFEQITSLTLTGDYMLYEVSLANYAGNGYYVALRNTASNYIYVDNISLEQLPECPRPQNLSAAAMTNSATLTWESDQTDFTLYYKESSATSFTQELNVTSPYTLSGLSPNTQYDWFVVAICNEDTMPSLPAAFQTACAEISSLPYFENFDNMPTGAAPTCWMRGEYHATYPQVYNTTSNVSSPYAVYYYYSNTLALPPVNTALVDLSNAQLRFWAKANSGNDIEVGFYTNPMDSTTFTKLVTLSPTSDYSEYTVSLSSHTSSMGSYVGFRRKTASGGLLFIDDVYLEDLPACLRPEITDVTISSTDVTVSWHSEDSYLFNLYYKTDADTAYTEIAGITDTFYVFSALPSNTQFTWYVAGNCDDGTYATSYPNDFVTPLEAVELPYTADFSETDEWKLNNGGCTNYWVKGAIDNTTDGLFVTTNGTTPGYATSSTTTVTAEKHLVVGESGSVIVSFDFRCAGESTYDYMKVFLAPMSENYPGSNASPTWAAYGYETYAANFSDYLPLTGNQTAPYKINLTQDSTIHIELVMANPNVNPSYDALAKLVFMWKNDISGGTQPAAIVSNLSVTTLACDVPSMPVISNITANSADVSWTANASSFVLQYAPTGVSWDDSSVMTDYVSGNSISLTSLNASTTYQLRIASLCGSDTSIWRFTTFTTECEGLVTLPYFCGFEDVPAGNYQIPLCWTKGTQNTTYPYSYSTSSAYQGSRALYFYTPNYICLPSVDGQSIDLSTTQVSFYAKGNNYKLVVGIMSDPTDFSTFTPIDTLTFATDYAFYEVSFADYTGTGTYVTLRNIAGNYIYLDEIVLDFIPNCASPSNLVASNVTQSSVELSWTGNVTNYNLYYKAPDSPTYTMVPNVTLDATGTYLLTGLTSGTPYQWYVAAICEDNTESASHQTNSFTTMCDLINTLPVTWDFETYEASTQLPVCWTVLNPTSSGPKIMTSYATSGSHSLRLYDNSPITTVILPPVDNTVYPVNGLRVRMFAQNMGTYPAWDVLVTGGVITDPLDDATFVPVDTFHVIGAAGGSALEYTLDMSGYQGVTGQVAIQFQTINACRWLNIDDLTLEYTGPDTTITVTDPTVATNAADPVAQTTATLHATITNPDNVTITAKGFQWKATTGGTYTQVAGTGTGNTFTADLTNLSPNTSYTFKAFITFNGTTVEGDEMTFTTLPEDTPEPCDVPTNLHASTCDAHSITIGWNTNGNATSWNIQYRVENGNWSSATSNTNTYVINGLTAETLYEIEVQANCGNGNLSDWSEPIHISTTIDGIDSWLENSVTLFPNPAREYIDIRVDGDLNVTMMEVYDVYGKLVNTLGVCDTPVQTRINVSGLADGMYFVRVTTDRGVVTKSFVKK